MISAGVVTFRLFTVGLFVCLFAPDGECGGAAIDWRRFFGSRGTKENKAKCRGITISREEMIEMELFMPVLEIKQPKCFLKGSLAKQTLLFPEIIIFE